jgi:hypothetical protein
MSTDQISTPFSFSSSTHLIAPRLTLATAIFLVPADHHSHERVGSFPRDAQFSWLISFPLDDSRVEDDCQGQGLAVGITVWIYLI